MPGKKNAKYSVGVIGCGVAATARARAFDQHPPVMGDGRYHPVGVEAEIVGLQMLELEQIHMAAFPFHALFAEAQTHLL